MDQFTSDYLCSDGIMEFFDEILLHADEIFGPSCNTKHLDEFFDELSNSLHRHIRIADRAFKELLDESVIELCSDITDAIDADSPEDIVAATNGGITLADAKAITSPIPCPTCNNGGLQAPKITGNAPGSTITCSFCRREFSLSETPFST